MQFAFAIAVVRIVWLIARFIGYLWRRRGRDPVSLVIDRGWIDVEGTLQSSRFVAAGGHWAHGSGPKTPLMAISVDVTTNYLVGWGNEQCGSQVELQRKCSNNPGPSH